MTSTPFFLTPFTFMDEMLKKLATKGETERRYPVSESDLIHVDACPVCGSGNTNTLTEVFLERRLHFFSTAVCNDCLFVFRSISPSHRWFQERWAQIASGEPEVFNAEVENMRTRRYEEYLALLQPHVPEGRVLDIGAAFGAGCRVFMEAGYEVEALEPEDDRSQFIREKLGIRTHGSVLQDFKPNTDYDLILFSQCFEHISDPAIMLDRVRNLLSPQGILYLEVPVSWTFIGWRDAFFMAHQGNFTESNIGALLSHCGLVLLEKTYQRMHSLDVADLGVIVAATDEKPATVLKELDDTRGRGAADLERLYRLDFPLSDPPPLGEPIRYSVPFINHFYYTVRLDEGVFVDHRADSGFIEFEPASASGARVNGHVE